MCLVDLLVFDFSQLCMMQVTDMHDSNLSSMRAGANLLSNSDRDRICIVATDSFAADSSTTAGDASIVLDCHEKVPCCGDGWASFWTLVVLGSTVATISALMLPDLATAYFNAGVDPCAGDGAGTPRCVAVVTKVTNLSNIFATGSAIISLVCNTFVGAAADIWGRRTIMIIAVILGKINALSILSVEYLNASIYLFFATSELMALVPSIVISNLWVADRAPARERAKVFGRLQAAMLTEGIVIPIFTTFLTRNGSSIALLICSLGAILMAVFFFKESLPREKRIASQGSQCRRLFTAFRALVRLFQEPLLRQITAIMLLGDSIQEGYKAVFLLYLKEQYGLTMQTISPILALNTASNFVVLLCFIKPMEQFLGLRMLIVASLLFGILLSIGWLCAGSYFSLCLVASFSGLSSAANPAVWALFSNVATAEQGSSIGIPFGAFLSLAAIPPICGPLLFRSVFVFFLDPNNPLGCKIASSPWILVILINISMVFLVLRMPRSTFRVLSLTHG